MAMSYAQNGEDLIIADYFGDYVGNLLSIGENDGETFSNVKLLIDKDWKATLFEPSLAYDKLSALYYNEYPRVECHNLAISDKRKVATWYELEDSLLSTCNKYLADKWGRKYNTRQIDFVTCDFIIGQTFDFISIDAEGEDWNILKQIDLNDVGCKCLIVEHSNQFELITNYCAQFGLKEIHRNSENIIFCK